MTESLSVYHVSQSIDEVIDGRDSHGKTQQELKQKGFSLRRASTAQEWHSMLAKVSSQVEIAPTIPFHFGIGMLRDGEKTFCGVITFYLAYSTWDGRFLFVDHLEVPGKEAASEKLLLRTLAQVAVKLGAARLTWRHTETPSWYVNDPNPPEILHEWLTLRMDRLAMETYASELGALGGKPKVADGAFNRSLVESAVRDCLEGVNKSGSSEFQLRLSCAKDVNTIARLVHGLAVYEKEPDAVNVTADDYLRDGGSDEPLFYCLLFDHTGDNEQVYTCGMAFVYFGYILGEGRFLYLEDLFLEEAYRKKGGGGLAMQSLARLGLSLQCTQFYWAALDWNTPALNLYKKIGAKVQEGVLTTRYSGEALKSFAK